MFGKQHIAKTKRIPSDYIPYAKYFAYKKQIQY